MEYIDYLGNDIKDIHHEYDDLLHMRVKSEYVCDYHKKMIFQGRCDTFLPARYVDDSGETMLFYDLDGVVPLERYIHEKDIKADDVLNMIMSVIHAIREAENLLLMDEEIVISLEKMFIDEKSKVVKLIYEPGGRKEKSTFNCIMDMIKKISSDRTLSSEMRTGLSNYYSLLVSGCRNIDDMEKMTRQYISAAEISGYIQDERKNISQNKKSISGSKKKKDAKVKGTPAVKAKGASVVKTKSAREYMKDAFIRLIT